MQAVRVTPSTRWVELIEMEETLPPVNTQVRVAVSQVGLCPMDWAVINGATSRYASSSKSIIIGHEMVGRAVELGRDVTSIRLGDLVVVTARRGCHVCETCKTGRSDLCFSGLYTERGVYGADGFMAEYILEDEINIVSVPMNLHNVAVLVEPLSLVVKAVSHARIARRGLPARCGHDTHRWDRVNWAQCKRVLVTGTGALGLLSALMLREAGADVVIYGESGASSLQSQIARLAGGEYFSVEDVPLEVLSDWIGLFDLVLEVSGNPAIPRYLIPLILPNALVVLLGPPPTGPIQSGDDREVWRNLAESNSAVLGTGGAGREHFEGAVGALNRVMKRFPSLVPQLITHRVPMVRCEEVFDQKDSSMIKAVVDVA